MGNLRSGPGAIPLLGASPGASTAVSNMLEALAVVLSEKVGLGAPSDLPRVRAASSPPNRGETTDALRPVQSASPGPA